MTTIDFAKQEKMVIEVLALCPRTRDDDYIMMAEIIRRYYPALSNIPFEKAMREHESLGVPSFESFTRVRRKVQSKVPALQSKERRNRRAKREEEFKDYSREELNT